MSSIWRVISAAELTGVCLSFDAGMGTESEWFEDEALEFGQRAIQIMAATIAATGRLGFIWR
jgi:hypothetical protein